MREFYTIFACSKEDDELIKLTDLTDIQYVRKYCDYMERYYNPEIWDFVIVKTSNGYMQIID